MLENCQPDSEKGTTYAIISKWPKLTEVVTNLSSQSNALLRLCIMVSIKSNASFSVASKNLSVTLEKAEIYSASFTPFKPSGSQAEWELSTKRRREFKKRTDRFTQDWLGGAHRWCQFLGDYCKCSPREWSSDFLHSGLNFPSWVITQHRDQVRYTLPASSCGSKQDVVVVRWVLDFLQGKKAQKSETRAHFQHM